MTKSTTEDGGTKIQTEEQLNFFFWLGDEGELESVSENDFKEKQEQWNGQRPTD